MATRTAQRKRLTISCCSGEAGVAPTSSASSATGGSPAPVIRSRGALRHPRRRAERRVAAVGRRAARRRASPPRVAASAPPPPRPAPAGAAMARQRTAQRAPQAAAGMEAPSPRRWSPSATTATAHRLRAGRGVGCCSMPRGSPARRTRRSWEAADARSAPSLRKAIPHVRARDALGSPVALSAHRCARQLGAAAAAARLDDARGGASRRGGASERASSRTATAMAGHPKAVCRLRRRPLLGAH